MYVHWASQTLLRNQKVHSAIRDMPYATRCVPVYYYRVGWRRVVDGLGGPYIRRQPHTSPPPPLLPPFTCTSGLRVGLASRSGKLSVRTIGTRPGFKGQQWSCWVDVQRWR
jgi:hypothetical protein